MIDPGIVADSPFLSDDFVITQRAETISDYGRPVLSYSHRDGHGIVTMATAKDLELVPENETADNAISVITRSEIRQITPGALSDVITWAGTSYKVLRVLPYPRYGQGWYKAIAGSMNAVDLMPQVDV